MLSVAAYRIINKRQRGFIVADGRVSVTTNSWPGVLWRHGQELAGSIAIDPAVRPLRQNGSMDAGVILKTGDIASGPDLDSWLSTVASGVMKTLDNLEIIKSYIVNQAPVSWRERMPSDGSSDLVGRLFLDGFEVDEEQQIAAMFDYGDLDMIVVQVNVNGLPVKVDVVS